MINSWVSLDDDYVFGDWFTELKFNNAKSLYSFIDDFLSVGIESNFFYLSNDVDSKEEVKNAYIRDLQRIELKSGYCLLFNIDNVNNECNNENTFKAYYDVCFYDNNGNVKIMPILSLGKILKEINPKETEMVGYTEDVSPVVITSTPINLKTKLQTSIHVKLKTNLFFPKVPSILEASKKMYPGQKKIDNLELSLENVQIFNNWFQKINNLIQNNGGEFACTPPYSLMKNNTQYLTNKGIIID